MAKAKKKNMADTTKSKLKKKNPKFVSKLGPGPELGPGPVIQQYRVSIIGTKKVQRTKKVRTRTPVLRCSLVRGDTFLNQSKVLSVGLNAQISI
jgi:hypothetical protein